MKIPLIMREQYQGQLSASMLYILLCRTGFMAGSFFLEKIILIRKTKKHRNLLRCRFQNGDLGRTRTCDLEGMNLTSCRLLHPAILVQRCNV